MARVERKGYCIPVTTAGGAANGADEGLVVARRVDVHLAQRRFAVDQRIVAAAIALRFSPTASSLCRSAEGAKDFFGQCLR